LQIGIEDLDRVHVNCFKGYSRITSLQLQSERLN